MSIESFRALALVLTLLFAALLAILPTLTTSAAVAGGAAVLCAVLLGGVILVFSSRLIATLRADAETARRIHAGDYAARIEPSGSGVLGEARTASATMLDDLKQRLGLAKGVMDFMVTPFVVTDLEENFIFGNQRLIEMLQHTGKPEDYYGQNVAVFFYGEKRDTVLGVAMREKRSISKEVVFTGRKGRKLHINIDASPLYDLEGRMIAALCVYTDLSDVRMSEAKLTRQGEKIAEAVRQIDTVSQKLFGTASELTAQVHEVNQNSCRQAERAMETARAMGEMNSAVLEIARSASDAASEADMAKTKAYEGAEVVEKAVHAIAEVSRLSAELKQNLDGLGRRAEAIGRIMDVISDIADQTNLLALNAAIEAARAGDAGRGFAVVADEVRKLAEKTMNATKEVGDSILAIQQDTRANVEGMDKAAQAVELSSQLAGESGSALKEIVSLVLQTTDRIRAIAAASEQQSASSEQINVSVEAVRRSCDETSQEMGRATTAVTEINSLAQTLRGVVQETLS
ncbi:methyl-accepting chemotaxis sensory transducer with Pas/Pac sensor [Desulfovibrio sp. X2]|uniref:methyl-accepting chemotaxis protein n=1 Tax=Desulfovibrio sp. X2 TaxID=941449 RepID=UPI0003588EC2|nr:methyl-accepting chemotaxis protein [Desulfovibrio sp. X2]EPR44158.1 methyl-accepting chemotaxis sensory transducer with Pas/Pac sensor [Desulfovibrio sp. X2]